MINIDKLTPDEQKRALCLACERSLLSGQCKCANPNWVLAVDALDLVSRATGVPPELVGQMGSVNRTPALGDLPFGKKAQLARPKRGNKYNAVRSKSLITKRFYDSGAERDFADVLQAREADGIIAEIVAQPVIELGPEGEIKYKPDFVYWEITECVCSLAGLTDNINCEACKNVGSIKSRRVWVDVKGAETERFKIIKRLWKYNGPGPLEIVKRKGKGQPFLVTQTIMPIT